MPRKIAAIVQNPGDFYLAATSLAIQHEVPRRLDALTLNMIAAEHKNGRCERREPECLAALSTRSLQALPSHLGAPASTERDTSLPPPGQIYLYSTPGCCERLAVRQERGSASSSRLRR